MAAALRRVAIVFLASSRFTTSSPVNPPFNSFGDDINFIGTSFGVPGVSGSYDYVIVGGGTAGLVVAARLAESKSTSVAVIEAGGFYEIDNGNISVIPADAIFYSGADPSDTQPLIDWGINTVPQRAINGRTIHYARGKTLGGSSARNFLVYQRGTNDSYSAWANDVGDSQYEFGNFLKYFTRSATFTPPNVESRPANASLPLPRAGAFSEPGGPLQVTVPNWANAFAGWVRNGLLSLGLPDIQDYVSGGLIGSQFHYHCENPADQTRSSSETSYLRRALATTDLVVYKNALAKRIVFDHDKKATGVEINIGGLTSTIGAEREVILSSGVFQSPQILMVSGIGPQETLDEYSIPLIQNSPGVGQNMWDHWFYGPSYTVNVETHSILGNPVAAARFTNEYRAEHTGMLTNLGGDILGWEKLPYPERAALSPSASQILDESFPSDWPELEYIVNDAYGGNQSNYIRNAPQTTSMYAGISAALVAPLSRGNVTIRSADTAELPVVNPNWLDSPVDQELAVAGFNRIRQIVATNATSPAIIEEVYPGSDCSSREDILEFIKNNGNTVWHASGTCKMGKGDDPMAVVDAQGRVFGVSRLRVVDNSVFPLLPPGHPQATTYALAEKIVDDILKGE